MGFGLCLVALALPQTVLADVSCERDPAGAVLSISVTDGTLAKVIRAGDGIKVSDLVHPQGSCKAGATVGNTDRIEVISGEDSAAFIELSGGPFAPGLTPDADGTSEIEWEVVGPGLVELVGGRGRDHFRFMKTGTQSGLNLNPGADNDLDLVESHVSGAEAVFAVNGGAGADKIDGPGAAGVEAFAIGGPGDDTLLATPAGAILEGGPGSDRMIGSSVSDLIVPGRGADVVKAGGGGDELQLTRDGKRDRVNCGPGNDLAFGADRLDRLSSCR